MAKKAKATPSSQNTPQPSEKKHLTVMAQSKYASDVKGRKLFLERGFEFNSEPTLGQDQLVWTVVLLQSWRVFAGAPHPIAEELVKEFYANMPKGDAKKVFIRGRHVDFSPAAINKFYGLHAKTTAMFDFPPNPTAEQMAQVLQGLCLPNSKWETSKKGFQHIKYGSMKAGSRIWFNVVRTKLMPTSHTGTVSKVRAFLLYCIVQGLPVNVGNIINEGMKACASKKKGELWFPSLISGLCKVSGIPTTESEWKSAPITLTKDFVQALINKQEKVVEEEHSAQQEEDDEKEEEEIESEGEKEEEVSEEKEEEEKEEEAEAEIAATPVVGIGSRTRGKSRGIAEEKKKESVNIEVQSKAAKRKDKGKKKVSEIIDMTEEEEVEESPLMFNLNEDEETESEKGADEDLEEFFKEARMGSKSGPTQQHKRKRENTPINEATPSASSKVTKAQLMEQLVMLTEEVHELRSGLTANLEMTNVLLTKQIEIWKYQNAKSVAKQNLLPRFPSSVIPLEREEIL